MPPAGDTAPPSTDGPRVRLDKWLAVARVFKTRSQATHACELGRVRVNGTSVKPHRNLTPGDQIEVDRPAGLRRLVVLALAARSLPRDRAAALYRDESPPPPQRDPLERLIARPPILRAAGSGRPTKQDRRRLERALQGESAPRRRP